MWYLSNLLIVCKYLSFETITENENIASSVANLIRKQMIDIKKNIKFIDYNSVYSLLSNLSLQKKWKQFSENMFIN